MLHSRRIASAVLAFAAVPLAANVTADDVNGIWAGKTTHAVTGEETTWRLDLAAAIERAGSLTYNINGRGSSTWRGAEIPFMVFGQFNTSDGKGAICKVHTSEHTNYVLYDVEIGKSAIQLVGAFSAGKLELVERIEKKTVSVPAAASATGESQVTVERSAATEDKAEPGVRAVTRSFGSLSLGPGGGPGAGSAFSRFSKGD